MATVATLVVLVGGAAGAWLVGAWDLPATVTDVDRLRLDRMKAGLTIAAGLAAGATLLIALRRQAQSERAQRVAEHNELEQRTTAWYVAAADQLGSESAAVRLAGLYALERVGQNNPKLRQTVFDVWCAYLRMPYTPPLHVFRRNAKGSPARQEPGADPPDEKVEAERRQELEVRLTAQRLLATHLEESASGTEPSNIYWHTDGKRKLSVNLTSAILVDFSLKLCSLDRAAFDTAHFYGTASLDGTHFHGDVSLSGTEFHGNASLGSAVFHGKATFEETQFHGNASLDWARFRGDAALRRVKAHDGISLHGAQFYELLYMADVQFRGKTDLELARFYGSSSFAGAQFYGPTTLSRVQFLAPVSMGLVQFHGRASFDGAEFHATATLSARADLSGALATGSAKLPTGWELSATPEGDDPLRLIIRTRDTATTSDVLTDPAATGS